MSDDQDARGERLRILLTPDELTALDDFRFKERMQAELRLRASFSSVVWRVSDLAPRRSARNRRTTASWRASVMGPLDPRSHIPAKTARGRVTDRKRTTRRLRAPC
jgi:hypothetical protein